MALACSAKESERGQQEGGRGRIQDVREGEHTEKSGKGSTGAPSRDGRHTRGERERRREETEEEEGQEAQGPGRGPPQLRSGEHKRSKGVGRS